AKVLQIMGRIRSADRKFVEAARMLRQSAELIGSQDFETAVLTFIESASASKAAGNVEDAKRLLDTVIKDLDPMINPTLACLGFYRRALARRGGADGTAAIEDLTRAMELAARTTNRAWLEGAIHYELGVALAESRSPSEAE